MSLRTRFVPSNQPPNTPGAQQQTSGRKDASKTPMPTRRNTLIDTSNSPRPRTAGGLETTSSSIGRGGDAPKLNTEGLRKKAARNRQAQQQEQQQQMMLHGTTDENVNPASNTLRHGSSDQPQHQLPQPPLFSPDNNSSLEMHPPPYATSPNSQAPPDDSLTFGNPFMLPPTPRNQLIQSLDQHSFSNHQNQAHIPNPFGHPHQFSNVYQSQTPAVQHASIHSHVDLSFAGPESQSNAYMPPPETIPLQTSRAGLVRVPTPAYALLDGNQFQMQVDRDKRSSMDPDGAEEYERMAKRARGSSEGTHSTALPNAYSHHREGSQGSHHTLQPQEHDELSMFLGHDVDDYIAKNMQQFEAAKERWKNCTLEEWEKGAEEIGKKFGEVLELAKQRMMEKLALWGSLGKAASEHQTVIAERNDTLANIRQGLVKDAGGVVGSSLHKSDTSGANDRTHTRLTS